MHLRKPPMSQTIRLLGPPRVDRDEGVVLPPRGHKAWGLLAYLALTPGGAGRHHLAGLLFEEAQDPLAALRWNLSELRRLVGRDALHGECVTLPGEAEHRIDVVTLMRGRAPDALRLPGLGLELLEGMDFSGSPSFGVWLQAERRRVHATCQSVLREAALARLASRDAKDAASIAAQLVRMDPLDEAAQVLLVRCLAAAGDGIGAARQAAACRTLFARELGIEPSAALNDALHTVTTTRTPLTATSHASVLAQIEAGDAAIRAGAQDAGLECLRRAMDNADLTDNKLLSVRTRLALGGALVHAARGRDEEGAAALHEALHIGREVAPLLAAGACRELGYIEFLRGSYERAQAWLDEASLLAGDDLSELARVATLRGAILSDTAHYTQADEQLLHAIATADETGDTRQAVYARSMLGRALVLRGDTSAAQPVLDQAIEEANRLWVAFLPWPLSFRAEVDLAHGDLEDASERFEHAFALGCQLSDPCWEGIAGRGRALVALRRGDHARAVDILMDTLQRSARLPDSYAWGRAYALEVLCRIAVGERLPNATQWTGALAELATRSGMRELTVKAWQHRAALGEAPYGAAAALLARSIANPILQRSVAAPIET